MTSIIIVGLVSTLAIRREKKKRAEDKVILHNVDAIDENDVTDSVAVTEDDLVTPETNSYDNAFDEAG